jgi:cyclohexanone monooxygenase
VPGALDQSPAAGTGAEQDVDAVIVGAGLAGLYALHRLRGISVSAVVLEAADDIGGTWHWNRYPGCRCDVESLAYSYSFSDALQQEWRWSERYAGQPEILRYIHHVADRFDLRRDVRLGVRVAAVDYDDADGRWTVTSATGDRLRARFVVAAVGCLSTPKSPDVAGLERFDGHWYHTGRWPRERVDFSGLHVAVIGTGSSGVQVIPEIAAQAARLTVFQRTPVFTIPAQNRALTADEDAAMKAHYAEYREQSRWSTFGTAGPVAVESALAVDEETRRAAYEAAWRAGRVNELLGAFTDLMVTQEANDTAADFVRAKIAEIVQDRETAAALMPTSYPFGAKRPCMDTDYYATFNRPNVELVDLRDEPFEEITPIGVRTARRVYPQDRIVLAIGYDAITGSLLNLNIRGRGGVALSERWAAGPRAYLGLAAAGFPNLFMVTGPGSPSVLSNMVVSIEQHVDWIADCIAYLRGEGLTTIEAREEAETAWIDRVTRMADKTLMVKADSWYRGANVAGKPRTFMAFLGGVGNYRKVCERVAENGYEGFVLT